MTPFRWIRFCSITVGTLMGALAFVVFTSAVLVPAAQGWDWARSPTLAEDGPAMPEFTRRGADAWLNSRPLAAQELRGKVVLLEVYASG